MQLASTKTNGGRAKGHLFILYLIGELETNGHKGQTTISEAEVPERRQMFDKTRGGKPAGRRKERNYGDREMKKKTSWIMSHLGDVLR